MAATGGGSNTPTPTTYGEGSAVTAKPLTTATTYGDTAVIVVGLAAGFVLVPIVAEWNPELVNGFLLLLLFGIVLGRSGQWLPLLAQFGTATSKSTSKGKA